MNKKTIKKLAEIIIAWDELEENMGEYAALEVACQQNGYKDSQWFCENIVEYGNEVDVLVKIMREKK